MGNTMRVSAIVLCAHVVFCGASLAASSITPGASCQPRYGSDQGSLVHGIMGTGNNYGAPGGVVDVVCPLTRNVLGIVTGPTIKVYVSRNSNAGTTPLTCTLYTRTPEGAPSQTATDSFSGIGSYTMTFSPVAVGSSDYYVVLCSLPFEGGIRSIYMQE